MWTEGPKDRDMGALEYIRLLEREFFLSSPVRRTCCLSNLQAVVFGGYFVPHYQKENRAFPFVPIDLNKFTNLCLRVHRPYISRGF